MYLKQPLYIFDYGANWFNILLTDKMINMKHND